MKGRALNFLLILTSLFGYLEWGKDNSAFLFQSEYDVLTILFRDPGSMIHPFILFPLFGQLLLLVTLFQRTPGRILTFTGIGCLGLLLGFMFFIGIMGLNFKILISTLPFIITAVLAIRYHRRINRESKSGQPGNGF